MISQTLAAVPAARLPRMTLEIITVSGSWSPPVGVTTVYVEPCGGGQGANQDGNRGGESGSLGYGIFRNVTGPLSISIGAAGAASSTGGNGGDTAVTFGGVTITGAGGKTGGFRAGKPSPSTNANFVGAEAKSVPSLLLGFAGAVSPAPGGTSSSSGAGGASPLAPGGAGSSSGLPAGVGSLGSGGGLSASGTGAAGGAGYVLIGYYEVAA